MMSRILVILLLLLTGLAGCGGSSEQHAAEQAGQLYTCGMHPQVVQDGPGTCPICGMDLTPMDGGGSEVKASAAPDGERKIAYWQSPMDPTYVRDTPGKSPMGMDLVPVYEDEVKAEGNVVEISPGVIQQIGVETAPVERTTVFRHIRTIGEVEVGEDELSVVNLRFSGWVERIYVDKTGDEVKAGQALLAIYSPELVAAQEEYLLALRAQGADAPLARSARRKLELWDIADYDIRKLEAAGEAARTMTIRAPQAGFVLHKNVVEGARVMAGSDLYRIGNLQRIWVTAEVYEHDAPWIDVGQPAQLELTNLIDQTVEGKVVSLKGRETQFGFVQKMTVKVDTPDGVWLTWGTLPSALEAETAWSEDKRQWVTVEGAEVGATVRFDARLSVSDSDESFTFFSRPTRAVVL